MKTIKIRELRGAKLEEAARAGELIGLTRDRALIAILIPMVQAWLEHVVDNNWSRVLQSVKASDQALVESDLLTLDDALTQAAISDKDRSSQPKGTRPSTIANVQLERLAASLGLVDASAAELVRRLSVAFGLSKASEPETVATTTIGVRGISAHRIEQAGENQEILIVTHDRALLGMLVPVSQRLVEFLVTQNLSRITYNVRDAEQRVAANEPFATLEDVLSESDRASSNAIENAAHRAHH